MVSSEGYLAGKVVKDGEHEVPDGISTDRFETGNVSGRDSGLIPCRGASEGGRDAGLGTVRHHRAGQAPRFRGRG